MLLCVLSIYIWISLHLVWILYCNTTLTHIDSIWSRNIYSSKHRMGIRNGNNSIYNKTIIIGFSRTRRIVPLLQHPNVEYPDKIYKEVQSSNCICHVSCCDMLRFYTIHQEHVIISMCRYSYPTPHETQLHTYSNKAIF